MGRRMIIMKENRKILKDVLVGIRHDMSDEEVLNLLADSKNKVNLKTEIMIEDLYDKINTI